MNTQIAAKRITLTPVSTDPRPQQPDRIVVRCMDFIEFLPMAEITFVEAAGNYSTFVMNDGRKIMASKTIKHFEDLLSANSFLRPHQSYLVNRQHIRRVRKLPYCAICLDDGTEIPVARSRRTEVLEVLTAAAI